MVKKQLFFVGKIVLLAVLQPIVVVALFGGSAVAAAAGVHSKIYFLEGFLNNFKNIMNSK